MKMQSPLAKRITPEHTRRTPSTIDSASNTKKSTRKMVHGHIIKVPSAIKPNAPNPLTGTLTPTDLHSLYQDQSKILGQVGRSIEKITPSTPWRDLEGYKLELNQVLEFFDQAKKRLDHGTTLDIGPLSGEKIETEMGRSAETISQEIEQLRAKALEVSVELEMQSASDENTMEEMHDSLFRNPKPLAAYHSLRQYHGLLERLLTVYQQATRYQTELNGLEK